jgi:hypothetical protein
MSFTVLYAALVLLALLMIFGFTYKIKGIKTAFVATGIAFVVFAVLGVAMIYAVVSAMLN